MKKKILTLCCAAAMMSSMPLAAETFSWGITGGLNVSKLDAESAQSNNGWYAGLTGKVTLPILNLGFDGSLLYSKERAGIMGNDEDASFISIPINLRYDFQLPVLSNVFVPFVFVGPQFDWNVNNAQVAWQEGETLNYFRLKNSTWKGNIGVGAILCNHLQISYAYSLPFSDSWYGTIASARENSKLSTHKIGVTYYF
jgi:hypothetical protein